MSFSKQAVNKPVTTLIIFIIATAMGIYCTFSLPLDLLPDMDIPYIIVYTSYGDAGPEEVERSLTRTMESVLSGVTGLKKMKSESSTGKSMIMMEFEYGVNLDAASNNIRDKIEMVRNYLPEESDNPVIFQMDMSMIPILGIVVTGARKPEELSKYVEDIIKPRFEQIDGVASANATGDREKCVHIDLPRDRLDAYELTFSQIAQIVGAQNITSSGGSIAAGDSNYSISAEGMYQSIDDVRDTVVTYKPKGSGFVTVTLRDMANVYMGYKKATSEAYFDGKSCVMLMIQKQSGKNSVATANKVRKQLIEVEKELPADVKLYESFNTTDDIENSIKNVVESLVQGIILAVLVLYIFLRNFKSTFIIALSMPISVLITLMLVYFCGFTINTMTLSGLLLGIGMLVDNSIVVLENIFSYTERDAKPEVAAVLGSEEMIGSISASTLTSVCIFLPMILFKKMLGMMGQMFIAFAFTIIFSLLCSLVTAAVLVPVLSSKYLRIEKSSNKNQRGLYAKFDRAMGHFFNWLDHAYASRVKFVLHHKAIVLGVIALLFVVSIIGVAKIGFVFMPDSVNTSLSLKLEMPKGTKLEVTREVMEQMQQNVMKDLQGVKHTSLSVGGSSMGDSSEADSNTASLRITFYDEDNRQKGWDNDQTAKPKIRKYFNIYPGAEFTFESSGASSGASTTIDVVIKSQDLDTARQVARQIKKLMQDNSTDYFNEITMDLEDGLPELKVNMDRNRMYELGVTTYAAGAELSAAINGKTASRYDDEGKQIDIDVALDEKDKTTFGDLEQLYVANSMGKRIPFASFSRYEQTFSPVTIRRENQMRTVRVSIEPKNTLSLTDVQARIEQLIRENIVLDENVILTYEGALDDMIDSVSKFGIVILMAAILVFAVMASQFESFRDPFIIIFTIPLSFIGVVFIYFISGKMFNIVTVVGMLVLVGTIVNNGIVLVDYTNLLRKRGYKLEEACVEAAGNRLRPILMSTLTTVISLIPMAYFGGETGAMTAPIGLTVLGGMTFGSLMTLFVMPAIYYIFIRFNEKKEAKLEAKRQALEAKESDRDKDADLPFIVRRLKNKKNETMSKKDERLGRIFDVEEERKKLASDTANTESKEKKKSDKDGKADKSGNIEERVEEEDATTGEDEAIKAEKKKKKKDKKKKKKHLLEEGLSSTEEEGLDSSESRADGMEEVGEEKVEEGGEEKKDKKKKKKHKKHDKLNTLKEVDDIEAADTIDDDYDEE